MRSILRFSLLAPFFAAVFGLATVAHADTVYNFSYTGDGVSGSGFFDVNAGTIVAISGTANGSAIDVLLPGSDGGDEQFLAGGPPFFSFAGLSFDTVSGDDINLFYNNSGQATEEDFTGATMDTPITISITAAVPEPSSMFFLGTGILSVAGVARRRFVRS